MERAKVLSDVRAAQLACCASLGLPLSQALLLLALALGAPLFVIVGSLAVIAGVFAVTESLRRRLDPSPASGFAVSATTPFVEAYAQHLALPSPTWLQIVRVEWIALVLGFAAIIGWSLLPGHF